MSNPNPTERDVQRELCIDIDERRCEIERLLGRTELLGGYVRDDFGQGSELVARRIDRAYRALQEAHAHIDSAYNIATGKDA